MNDDANFIPVWVGGTSLVPIVDDDSTAGTGTVEERPLWGKNKETAADKAAGAILKVDPTKLQESLQDISNKLQLVLDKQEDNPAHSFYLESFTVGLALHANGGFTLIAEVGVEASIEVTFKRTATKLPGG